jgi:hypothetical protein
MLLWSSSTLSTASSKHTTRPCKSRFNDTSLPKLSFKRLAIHLEVFQQEVWVKQSSILMELNSLVIGDVLNEMALPFVLPLSSLMLDGWLQMVTLPQLSLLFGL